MQPANQHSGFEGEKEKILGRIREALRTEAPHPGHGPAVDRQDEKHGPQSSPIRQWLPFAGETFSEKLELFKSNATMLRAQFALLESKDELLARIQSLREEERWTKVGSHSGQLTDLVCRELKLPICRTDQPYQAADLETCNVGITECDALIAQTGSVLVTSRSAGGRALSILPPHHVVLARRDQLLRDLPEGFELLKRSYPPSYPSFISFITGPSRTGDIERILVLGAHGPKKLTILCV
ncbi:MAG TPA: LUD domain-containing protein [Verrucomicrobiae bacterium]|nr:LUD domain-containing protein [Verrucomicrobiae bacterium]